MIVEIVRDDEVEGLLEQGTPINAEELNKLNSQDDDGVIFTRRSDNTDPEPIDDKTQIYTKRSGETWLLPPGEKTPIKLGIPAETVGTFVEVDNKLMPKIQFNTDPQEQLTNIKHRISDERKQTELLIDNLKDTLGGDSQKSLVDDTQQHHFADISAKGGSVIAIKHDGTLWAWGDNSNGQLGLGDISHVNIPTQVGTDRDWAQISMGYTHAFAVKNWGMHIDEQVYATGLNQTGVVNSKTFVPIQLSTVPHQGEMWINRLVAGNSNSYLSFVDDIDQHLYVIGNNSNGQLGVGDTTNRTTWTNVPTNPEMSFWVTDINAIYCGLDFTIFRPTSLIFSCGNNQDGRTGLGLTSGNTLIPTQMENPFGKWNGVQLLSVGDAHCMGLFDDNGPGRLMAWGLGANARLGTGNSTSQSRPTNVFGTPNDVLEISCGADFTLIRRSDGSVHHVGSRLLGQGNAAASANNSLFTNMWFNVNTISNICAGGSSSFVMRGNRLFACGLNDRGQLGTGSVNNMQITFAPVVMPTQPLEGSTTEVMQEITNRTTIVQPDRGGTGYDNSHIRGFFAGPAGQWASGLARFRPITMADLPAQLRSIPNPPTANGQFVLRATVTNGRINYQWVAS